MSEYFASLDIFGWLEIAAMVVGFIYVLYEIRKSRKMWYFWLVSSILNIFVFWHSHYYSMMLIQFYYIGASIYGIAQWTKVKDASIEQHGLDDRPQHPKIAIIPFNKKKGVISAAVAVAAYLLLAPFFSSVAAKTGNISFAGQPYFDTAVAVLSMLATYWLSQSFREQWYIWIVVNVASMPIFFLGGVYWMSLLYVAYTVMCIIGMWQWRKYGVIVKQ